MVVHDENTPSGCNKFLHFCHRHIHDYEEQDSFDDDIDNGCDDDDDIEDKNDNDVDDLNEKIIAYKLRDKIDAGTSRVATALSPYRVI